MIYRIENSAILKTRKYPSVITGNTWRLLINKPWPKDSFFIERISLLMKRTNCQFFTLARFLSAEILLEIYSEPFSYKQPLETTAVQTFALHCSHSSSLLRVSMNKIPLSVCQGFQVHRWDQSWQAYRLFRM